MLNEAQKQMFLPVLAEVESLLPEFPEFAVFPHAGVLNQGFKAKTHSGKTLKFVAQDESLEFPEKGYEQRIYENGLIATRDNWHDFFNAMVWKTYPQLKSVLNAIHYQEHRQQDTSMRSRRRDWLTLFDENGVIVKAPEKFRAMIREHDWQSLFINHQQSWLNAEIQIHTFGHALYEKYLCPYIGMTAHALFVDESVEDIEKYLCQTIQQNQLLSKKSDLMPLPLLGIPGWHEQQNCEFYQNTQYFR